MRSQLIRTAGLQTGFPYVRRTCSRRLARTCA